MKKKIKFYVMLIIGISSILLLIGGKSQATLQSNPNTQYKMVKQKEAWIGSIREMENVNEAMGLSEERNASLTSTKSNNIDVHFMKSTEYGAIAILSASGYGNSSNEKVITSTTGNNTGMIINTGYYEWVSGYGYEVSGIDARYYDLYTNDISSAKVGDALAECSKWHSAQSYTWMTYHNYSCKAFCRGYGGIFSYNGFINTTSGSSYGTSLNNGVPSGYTKNNRNAFGRGVAVCGEGL